MTLALRYQSRVRLTPFQSPFLRSSDLICDNSSSVRALLSSRRFTIRVGVPSKTLVHQVLEADCLIVSLGKGSRIQMSRPALSLVTYPFCSRIRTMVETLV